MTQQQLEYFLELAKTLNFTKVSRHFMISQTAVSKQIQNLEDEIGVKLFNRTSRQVELTNAGSIFMMEAPKILAGMYSVISQLKNADAGFTGSINIGYAKGLEKTDFHKSLHIFKKDNPDLYFNLLRLNDIDIYNALDRGEIEIAFCQQYKSKEPYYKRISLFSIPVICIMTSENPLSEYSSLSFDDLIQEQLILTSSSALDSYQENPSDTYCQTSVMHKSTNPRMDLLPYFPSDFNPKKVIWTNDMESGILMASLGIGIAPVPAYSTYFNPSLNIKLIPLENNEKLVNIQAVSRTDNSNPFLKKLVSFLSDYYSQSVDS